MTNLKIAGKITQVLPLQEGLSQTGNAWKKQEFILEYISGNYPNSVNFSLFGERRIAENPVQVGQEVTVSFDVRSREYNGRWYTNCEAWRVEAGDTTGAAPQQQFAQPAPAQAPAPQPAPSSMLSSQADDLPF